MSPPKRNNSVDALIKQRENAKKSIQRIFDLGEANPDELSAEELDCRLEIVEAYFTHALELQTSIEASNNSSENINAVSVRAELEDLYCSIKVRIRILMKKRVAKEPQNTSAAMQSKVLENLPKLKLPTFSGKYSEFQNFFRLFKTLVHEDYRLSKIEKFNHLVACLSGSAFRTVKALDILDKNYELALSLLESRFNNKYLMCQDHLKELIHMNEIQRGSADQLRCLIDTVAANFNALSSLLNQEEIANAFVVHLVVAALDTDSQSKVEEAIDCNKVFNWADCSKILTQRCRMLEAHESNSSSNTQRQYRSAPNKQLNKLHKQVALSAVNNFCNLCKHRTKIRPCKESGFMHKLFIAPT